MAILTAAKVWKRAPSKAKLTAKLSALTAEEQANVLAFALKLRAEYRSWEAFAVALGVKQLAAFRACTGLQEPCAGLALRLARMAKVSVEDVLSGAFAKPGCCPMCGK
ncbi:MAG TPA: hypothetical protein VK745_16695 [Polyangiaceae bacterium]|jgi:hypothetical protein|nr:hypothetical protein [Polyangiaceae bacterium]